MTQAIAMESTSNAIIGKLQDSDMRAAIVSAAREARTDVYRISGKDVNADIFLSVSIGVARDTNKERSLMWYHAGDALHGTLHNVRVSAEKSLTERESIVFMVKRDVYTKAGFVIETLDQEIDMNKHVNVNQTYWFTFDLTNKKLVILDRAGSGENAKYTSTALDADSQNTVAANVLRFLNRLASGGESFDARVDGTVFNDALTHYGLYVDQLDRASKRPVSRNKALAAWNESHSTPTKGIPEKTETEVEIG